MRDVGYSELDVDLPRERRSSGVKGPGEAAGAAGVNTVVPVWKPQRDPGERSPRGRRGTPSGRLRQPWFIVGVSHRGSRWPLAVEPAPARNLGTWNMGRFYSGCAVGLQ